LLTSFYILVSHILLILSLFSFQSPNISFFRFEHRKHKDCNYKKLITFRYCFILISCRRKVTQILCRKFIFYHYIDNFHGNSHTLYIYMYIYIPAAYRLSRHISRYSLIQYNSSFCTYKFYIQCYIPPIESPRIRKETVSQCAKVSVACLESRYEKRVGQYNSHVAKCANAYRVQIALFPGV